MVSQRRPWSRGSGIGFDQPVSLVHSVLVGDLELNPAAQSRSILFGETLIDKNAAIFFFFPDGYADQLTQRLGPSFAAMLLAPGALQSLALSDQGG